MDADGFVEEAGDFGDDFSIWNHHSGFDSANNGRSIVLIRTDSLKGGVSPNFWESRIGKKSAGRNPRFLTEDFRAVGYVFAFVKWIYADG